MQSHPNVAARVASGTRCPSECAQSSRSFFVTPPMRTLDRWSVAIARKTSATCATFAGSRSRKRQADRTAIEAAQVHGGLGRLRLTEFARQRAERIPKPVQVARGGRIALLERPVGRRE